jgi:predicted PurR-regulated permease PerM
VFFAVIGGLKAFGALGPFIGPLILAITVALFTFLREEKRTGSWDLQFDSRPEDEARQFLGSGNKQYGSHITH